MGACAPHPFFITAFESTLTMKCLQKDMKTIVMEMGKPEEEKRISDPMFQWRTLRMLARSNLKIYSDCITERDADLQYAACVFLKDEDDSELKTKAKVRPARQLLPAHNRVCSCKTGYSNQIVISDQHNFVSRALCA